MSLFDRIRRGLVTLQPSPAPLRPVTLQLAPLPPPPTSTTLPAPVQPAGYITDAEIDAEIKELWFVVSPHGYVDAGYWERFLLLLDGKNDAYLRIINGTRQSIADAPLGREFRL